MMASESGQESRETLADIVAEIRAYGAQPPPRLMWLEIADRIEAAHKRESAEWEAAACACVSDAVMSGKVAVEHVPVGNAAAMREALIEIEKMAHIDLCNVYPKYRNKFNNLVGGIERIARAALSAPARNCDAMSRSMCTTQFSTTYEGNRDGLCDLQTEREKNIHLYYMDLIDWLFAPAAERKGEGDGR